MKNDIRKTLRIPKVFDEELTKIAKENKMTFNALIINILYSYMNNFNHLNEMAIISKKLDKLEEQASKNEKKLKWQTKLLTQLFVNSGFPRNRTMKEDKAYNDLMKNYYGSNL